jgi:hypothetical protein
MRIVITVVGFAAAVVAATGAVSAQQVTTDENGCRIVKRSELDRNSELSSSMQAGRVSSSVTVGNGAVSGSTTSSGSSMASSVTAGNGQVTTSNTVDGQTTTRTMPGRGASASASSSDENRTVVTTSDSGCTVILEKE